MGPIIRFIRCHIGASVATGVAVAALVGGSIAYEVTAPGSTAPARASSPPVSAPPTPQPPNGAAGAGGHRAKHPGVRGTVTVINGSTWTVKTARGTSMTVTITSQTAFGTKKAPSSASSFPVGATVRVVGQQMGTSLTATRILAPQAGGGGGGTTTSSTTLAPLR